jgi:hypothetical protein
LRAALDSGRNAHRSGPGRSPESPVSKTSLGKLHAAGTSRDDHLHARSGMIPACPTGRRRRVSSCSTRSTARPPRAGGAAPPRRRPSLRLAAADGPRRRLGARYMIAAEIGEIERFSSPKKLCGYTGLCPRVSQSGLARLPRLARQERAEVPALGADRGGDPCRAAPGLPGALRAHGEAARKAARQEGRPRRHREKGRGGELADAHPQPTPLLGQAPRPSLWRHDRPHLRCATGARHPLTFSFRRRSHREMSSARTRGSRAVHDDVRRTAT